jgi:hypothetical protein
MKNSIVIAVLLAALVFASGCRCSGSFLTWDCSVGRGHRSISR